MILVLAVPVPTAQAGWRIDRATAIAWIVWHHPCVDRMKVTWGDTDTPEDHGHGLIINRAAGMAFRERCAVLLDEEERQPWPVFCTVILHEAGHLAGMPHARKGIMRAAPQFVLTGGIWEGADRRCRDRGRPYLERHEWPMVAG